MAKSGSLAGSNKRAKSTTMEGRGAMEGKGSQRVTQDQERIPEETLSGSIHKTQESRGSFMGLLFDRPISSSYTLLATRIMDLLVLL